MSEHPLFTDEYLSKLTKAAERYFTFRVKILYTRKPIDIEAGVAEYKLPDDVVDLMCVRYKGKNLIPLHTLSSRDKNIISITNKNVLGTPMYFYIKESQYNTIRFYPVPSETIQADPASIDYDYGISSQCILYYYVLASDENELPTFLRRRLTKYYVMKYAYQKEGNTQDLKAAKYFESKMEWALNEMMSFVRDCAGSRYIYIPEDTLRKPKVARPVLPFNFPEK